MLRWITSCVSSCYTTYSPENVLSDIRWNEQPFVSTVETGLCSTRLGDCRILSSFETLRYSTSIHHLVSILQKQYRYIDLTLVRTKKRSIVPVIKTQSCYIPFEEFLIVIRDFGWKSTDFPLFLNLHIPIGQHDVITYIRMLVETYLEHRLVHITQPIGNYTLEELKDKIIIFTNGFIPYLDSCVYTEPIDIPILSNQLGLCSRRIDSIYQEPNNTLFRVVSLRNTNYDTSFFRNVHFTPLTWYPNDETVVSYEQEFKGQGIQRILRYPKKTVCFL